MNEFFDKLQQRIEKHSHRIELVNRLRRLHRAIPGSKLSLETAIGLTFPVWVLKDRDGVSLAQVSSKHVMHGVYSDFFEDVRAQTHGY